jgi:hypothetical protein
MLAASVAISKTSAHAHGSYKRSLQASCIFGFGCCIHTAREMVPMDLSLIISMSKTNLVVGCTLDTYDRSRIECRHDLEILGVWTAFVEDRFCCSSLHGTSLL